MRGVGTIGLRDRGTLVLGVRGEQRGDAVGRCGRVGRHGSRSQRRLCVLLTGTVGRDVVGDAVERFNAAQQLHARVEEVVDLALVIALLALALREHGVGHVIGGDLVKIAHILAGHAVQSKLGGGLVHNLVGQAIHLLAVVGGGARLAGAETLTLGAVKMLDHLAVQLLGLGLPSDTPMLGDLPRGLLVDHRTLKTGESGIDLCDLVAAAGQIEGDVLDIPLRQLRAVTVVQRVRALQKRVHLGGVVAPLALACPGDSGFGLLRHGLSTS